MTLRKIVGALLSSAILLGGGANLAHPEDAPKDNKGYTASKTTVVDLGPEFEAMAGRQLRLRLLTIEPGGHIGLHSHKDRSAVVYFMQETDTIIRDDGTSQIFHSGDTTGKPVQPFIGTGTTAKTLSSQSRPIFLNLTNRQVKTPPTASSTAHAPSRSSPGSRISCGAR
jgi:quercetin dioxygenase-like cupin family protein